MLEIFGIVFIAGLLIGVCMGSAQEKRRFKRIDTAIRRRAERKVKLPRLLKWAA